MPVMTTSSAGEDKISAAALSSERERVRPRRYGMMQ